MADMSERALKAANPNASTEIAQHILSLANLSTAKENYWSCFMAASLQYSVCLTKDQAATFACGIHFRVLESSGFFSKQEVRNLKEGETANVCPYGTGIISYL